MHMHQHQTSREGKRATIAAEVASRAAFQPEVPQEPEERQGPGGYLARTPCKKKKKKEEERN
jgi:hypothetical protein